MSFTFQTFAQNVRKDSGKFIEYTNETWENIKKEVEEFEKTENKKAKSFYLDFSNINIPQSIEEFKPVWHNQPVMQSSSNTCWSFASTSFIESEIYRIHKKEIKLSEMFTVYYEYIERAKRFIAERGNSTVSEGSQNNAILNALKKYGAVPLSVYSGMKPNQKHHSHSKLISEINSYLNNCKKNNIWNEKEILENVKSILNFHLNEPPTNFNYEGKNYTPLTFVKEFLKINPDDYIDFLSLMQEDYWEKVVYDVNDNWWKSDVYYNVPLDDFMNIINNSISSGYSLAIGGDVSEAGLYSYKEAAVVPSFDIPSAYIDENARQFRFSNKTTTDDHAIHIVGKTSNSFGDWYLIKDSGSGARNGNNKGYYFFHSDYIKLKIMTLLVHKDVVKDYLNRFN
jgi:bleomycin hydrolase